MRLIAATRANAICDISEVMAADARWRSMKPAKDGAAIELRDGEDEDLERAAANLGINLSRNESASVEDLA